MRVRIDRELLSLILKNAGDMHPKEMLLLLRGKSKRGVVELTEFLFPPFVTRGRDFAGFPLHALPLDPSIMGSVHSHPSGILIPSAHDMNYTFGRLLMIVAYPYGETNIAVYAPNEEKLLLEVV